MKRAVLILAVACCSVWGQVGASSDRGHGWIVSGDSEGAVLWHVAPRSQGASDGSLRFAHALASRAIAVAAREDEVVLVFARRGSMHAVRRLTVHRGRDGRWHGRVSGRLEALPGFGDSGEIAGACGDRAGTLVLVRDGADLRLWRLERGRWSRVALPAEVAGTGGEALVSLGDGRSGLVAGSVLYVLDGEVWERRLLVPGPWQGGTLVGGWGGVLVGVVREVGEEGDAWVLWRVRSNGSDRLGRVAIHGEGGVWCVLSDVGRAVYVEPREEGRVRLVEVSLLSGRVLYDGPARIGGPVSARDMRVLLLAVLLIVFMVVTMAGVGAGRHMELAGGLVPASLGLRGLGSGMDLMLGAVIGGQVLGAPLARMLWLEGGLDGAIGLGTSLLVACVLGTLLEGISGASVGKWVLGLRVVGVDGQPVGIARSAVRNGVKWLVPISGVGAWLDPQGRHIGDRLAGAVVVSSDAQD